ncbi:MAG: HAMP domain-containing sensor histidine kinase [Myxococcales bacterium]
MVPRLSRLTFRIYGLSLALLVAILGCLILAFSQSVHPHARGIVSREALFAVQGISERLHEPDALGRELARVKGVLGGAVSVYDFEGRLITSNVQPPLAPLAPTQLAKLRVQSSYLEDGVPPRVAVPLGTQGQVDGYALYLPNPPPPLQSAFLWAFGGSMIATAVASIILARSFAAPLAALALAARKLGAGDLNVRVGLRRNDEFGELANTFDEMAERVAKLLRAQQELIANVSHELRTPMARIRVALDLADEGDASMARESLSAIAEDLGELEQLVTDVLHTARLDLALGKAGEGLVRFRGEQIEMEQLLAKAASRFRASHPERTLEFHCEPELPVMTGNAMLLRRVLENLLENAHAYSDSDSAVELTARHSDALLTIAVQDRGIGIAAADLPYLATPFFRTDRSRSRRSGGLGLGLSMAKRIVEAHEGTLSVESALGQGTRVSLSFPTHDQQHA